MVHQKLSFLGRRSLCPPSLLRAGEKENPKAKGSPLLGAKMTIDRPHTSADIGALHQPDMMAPTTHSEIMDAGTSPLCLLPTEMLIAICAHLCSHCLSNRHGTHHQRRPDHAGLRALAALSLVNRRIGGIAQETLFHQYTPRPNPSYPAPNPVADPPLHRFVETLWARPDLARVVSDVYMPTDKMWEFTYTREEAPRGRRVFFRRLCREAGLKFWAERKTSSLLRLTMMRGGLSEDREKERSVVGRQFKGKMRYSMPSGLLLLSLARNVRYLQVPVETEEGELHKTEEWRILGDVTGKGKHTGVISLVAAEEGMNDKGDDSGLGVDSWSLDPEKLVEENPPGAPFLLENLQTMVFVNGRRGDGGWFALSQHQEFFRFTPRLQTVIISGLKVQLWHREKPKKPPRLAPSLTRVVLEGVYVETEDLYYLVRGLDRLRHFRFSYGEGMGKVFNPTTGKVTDIYNFNAFKDYRLACFADVFEVLRPWRDKLDSLQVDFSEVAQNEDVEMDSPTRKDFAGIKDLRIVPPGVIP